MVLDLQWRVEPTIVFNDRVRLPGPVYSFEGGGGLTFVIDENNPRSFLYHQVSGVYWCSGNPIWENEDYNRPRVSDTSKMFSGIQVIFTDKVIYEGSENGRHFFTFLTSNGEYQGENSPSYKNVSFPFDITHAVFYRTNLIAWPEIIELSGHKLCEDVIPV